LRSCSWSWSWSFLVLVLVLTCMVLFNNVLSINFVTKLHKKLTHYKSHRGLLHHRKRCGCHCSTTTPPTSQHSALIEQQQEKQLQMYIEHINSPMSMSTSLSEVFNKSEFSLLREFFECILCSPCSKLCSGGAVFSQSGLLLRPHRSRMSDGLLESLVFLKCN